MEISYKEHCEKSFSSFLYIDEIYRHLKNDVRSKFVSFHQKSKFFPHRHTYLGPPFSPQRHSEPEICETSRPSNQNEIYQFHVFLKIFFISGSFNSNFYGKYSRRQKSFIAFLKILILVSHLMSYFFGVDFLKYFGPP